MDRDLLLKLIDDRNFFIYGGMISVYLFFTIKTIIELIRDKNVNPPKIYNKQKQLNMIESKMKEMNGWEFEEFIGYILSQSKNKVEVTSKTRDGGKDIILNGNVYIECKRYAPHYSIDVNIVKKLYATIVADGLTRGAIVTTGGYTKSAIDLLQQYHSQGIHIARWDSRDILNYCKGLDCTKLLLWLGLDIDESIELKSDCQ